MPVKPPLKKLRLISYILLAMSISTYFWLSSRPIPHCTGMGCMAHGVGKMAELLVFVLPIFIIASAVNIVDFVNTKPNKSVYRKIELGVFITPIAMITFFALCFFL